jgi:hypothetical protein
VNSLPPTTAAAHAEDRADFCIWAPKQAQDGGALRHYSCRSHAWPPSSVLLVFDCRLPCNEGGTPPQESTSQLDLLDKLHEDLHHLNDNFMQVEGDTATSNESPASPWKEARALSMQSQIRLSALSSSCFREVPAVHRMIPGDRLLRNHSCDFECMMKSDMGKP